MGFTIIDRSKWPREEYFRYFLRAVPCMYSMTVQLDVTPIMRQHARPYPAMLYFLSVVENRHKEYRIAFNEQGELGYYDVVHPSYTVFHRDDHTFSSLWTEYNEDYRIFLDSYERDTTLYGDNRGLFGKPGRPANLFPVSVIPWVNYESLHLSFPRAFRYFIPMYTLGRLHRKRSHYYMPLALEVHHAVCDGYDAGAIIREIQSLINDWKG
ncbi:CatA-like O-acetyltransferase [Dialister sp.]|uniref:CatA-like O-acetyltransferase n=1 Tax=Dialister sp. TaxID=1955814 RepID=UPI002E8177C4|nr:CatA-like O-acetyltransferase [Dialister sp.]MEE3452206.1 CatA-like O-acetyltransferase [Dialister sp.]